MDEIFAVGAIAGMDPAGSDRSTFILALPDAPGRIECGSCGEVLIEGPVTLPAVLVSHLHPCDPPGLLRGLSRLVTAAETDGVPVVAASDLRHLLNSEIGRVGSRHA